MTDFADVRQAIATEISNLGFMVVDHFEPKPSPPCAIVTPVIEGDWVKPDITFAYDESYWQITVITGKAANEKQSQTIDDNALKAYCTLRESNRLDIVSMKAPGSLSIAGTTYLAVALIVKSTDALEPPITEES